MMVFVFLLVALPVITTLSVSVQSQNVEATQETVTTYIQAKREGQVRINPLQNRFRAGEDYDSPSN